MPERGRIDQPLVKPMRCACGFATSYFAGWLKHINFEGEHVQVKQ